MMGQSAGRIVCQLLRLAWHSNRECDEEWQLTHMDPPHMYMNRLLPRPALVLVLNLIGVVETYLLGWLSLLSPSISKSDHVPGQDAKART